jgi:hypothetical protein
MDICLRDTHCSDNPGCKGVIYGVCSMYEFYLTIRISLELRISYDYSKVSIYRFIMTSHAMINR